MIGIKASTVTALAESSMYLGNVNGTIETIDLILRAIDDGYSIDQVREYAQSMRKIGEHHKGNARSIWLAALQRSIDAFKG